MNAPANRPDPRSEGGSSNWQATLRLGFAANARGTFVAHRAHRGPLVIQRAFFPEGPAVAHVYVLHPPGGFVGGDSVTLEIDVAGGAHALVTTPAAGKAYRSEGARTATISQRFDVQADATLEWFPNETIVFDGARIDLGTEVNLHGNAAFAGWEILCGGRAARGERLTTGLCRQRFELWRDGVPLMIDKTRLAGGSDLLSQPFGLNGRPVLGTMVITPVVGDLATLRERLAAFALPARETLVVTLMTGALVCRYLGDSAERARQGFAQVWSAVRPALCGRPPCPPRIWST
jgi:urease accessory protein